MSAGSGKICKKVFCKSRQQTTTTTTKQISKWSKEKLKIRNYDIRLAGSAKKMAIAIYVFGTCFLFEMAVQSPPCFLFRYEGAIIYNIFIVYACGVKSNIVIQKWTHWTWMNRLHFQKKERKKLKLILAPYKSKREIFQGIILSGFFSSKMHLSMKSHLSPPIYDVCSVLALLPDDTKIV